MVAVAVAVGVVVAVVVAVAVAVAVGVAVGVGVVVAVVVGVVVAVGVGVVVAVVVGVVVAVVVGVVVGGDMTDPRTLAARLELIADPDFPVTLGYNAARDIRAAAVLLRDLAAERDELRAELDRRTDPDLAAVLRVLKVPYGHAYIESAARMIDREGPT